MLNVKARRLLIGLGALLPLVLLLASGSGLVPISWADHGQFLAYHLGFSDTPVTPQQDLILTVIRWPRVLMAALVGGCLAVSGATMQGLFRNPLADPSLIGVSGGAAVGASAAIVGGTVLSGHSALVFANDSVWQMGFVALSAFIGGFIATLVVYRLGCAASRLSGSGVGRISVSTMLLAGIAVNALAAAIISSFTYVASDSQLRKITLWQMGSFDGISWSQLMLASVVILLVIIALIRYAGALNVLLLGESEARHLGVAVDRLKWQLITLTALGVGVAVAMAGIIGFVGLVVPHLVRLLIGPDHRWLMPASALLGALLLVLADTLARTLAAPAEIPIGIITAVLGAPFFIGLLLQQRHRLALS